jgi:membrane fusion protein, multidrug efflux system
MTVTPKKKSPLWARMLMGTGIIALVLAIAGGLGFWFYGQMKAAEAAAAVPPPPMPETVLTAKAEQRTHQRRMTAVGTLTAKRMISVSNEFAGKVVEVGFESGQIIDEGAILIRLDTEMERSQLAAAEAGANLARVSLRRLTDALAIGAASSQEVDRVKAELDQAEAQIGVIKTMMSQKTLKAPFRGRVGLRDVQPGQYLAEGTTVAMLSDVGGEVYVDFSLPQQVAMGLKPSSQVELALPGLGSQVRIAKVLAMDPMVDTRTRNARLRASLSDEGGTLRPGMSVEVRVPLGEPQVVTTIPPTAVRAAPFGEYLFVLTPHKDHQGMFLATQRFVKTGSSVDGQRIILEGLKPGEVVATEGSFKLKDQGLAAEPPPVQGPSAAK